MRLMAKEKSDAAPPAPTKPADPLPVGRLQWLDDVAEHDYAAAAAYLSLKLDTEAVDKVIHKMRKATLTSRRANDILRAAGMEPAALDDPGVMKDLIKVIEGKKLSPVLVSSAKSGADIADGFHRISLAYRIDPYEEVPLKLV